jgi:hypothetical protein
MTLQQSYRGLTWGTAFQKFGVTAANGTIDSERIGHEARRQ